MDNGNKYILAYKVADCLGLDLRLDLSSGKLTGSGTVNVGSYNLPLTWRVTYSYMSEYRDTVGAVIKVGMQNLYVVLCAKGTTVGLMVLDGRVLTRHPDRKNPEFRQVGMKPQTFFNKVREAIVFTAYYDGERWIETQDFDKFEGSFV